MRNFLRILILAGVLCCPVIVQAVLVTLHAPDIEEAKKFGAENKKKIEEALEKLYGLGRQELLGHEVVVRTKWCKLALLASVKALEHAAITEQELKLILEDPLLQIDIRVCGNNLDFARDYSVLLRQNDKVIMPEKIHANHFQAAPRARTAPSGFPAYTATIRAYFTYEQLDPTAMSTLVVKKDSEEKPYALDLSAFK